MEAKARLIAGCAFAKDVLNYFLDPIKQVIEAECRDTRGNEARFTVPFFHKHMGAAKEWLTQNNMVLNEKKNKSTRTTANSRNNGNSDTRTTREN